MPIITIHPKGLKTKDLRVVKPKRFGFDIAVVTYYDCLTLIQIEPGRLLQCINTS